MCWPSRTAIERRATGRDDDDGQTGVGAASAVAIRTLTEHGVDTPRPSCEGPLPRTGAPMSRWESMMVFYGSSHRHPVNVVLHLLFVPVILGTSLGLLGALPGPLPLGWIGAAGLLAAWM